MDVDPMTLARARLALEEASRHYLFDPNVRVIDFGFPEKNGQIVEDELAIRFHVRQKLFDAALEEATEAGITRPIPASIGGFLTDVPQGAYRLQPGRGVSASSPLTGSLRTNRVNPMSGGISISDEHRNVYGTLGGLVTDRSTGAAMILSNWHVLVGNWSARPGQRIFQPGRLDGGRVADTIALLTRDAMSVNLDAAVATLSGSRSLINSQLNLGAVKGVGKAKLGMEVVKSGRKTGITFGRVTAIEGIAKMPYDGLQRIIRGVITIDQRQGNEEVSAGGDSGSWWLDSATMQAIGLHFAGSNSPERGLSLDMPQVLDALNVNIAVRP